MPQLGTTHGSEWEYLGVEKILKRNDLWVQITEYFTMKSLKCKRKAIFGVVLSKQGHASVSTARSCFISKLFEHFKPNCEKLVDKNREIAYERFFVC